MRKWSWLLAMIALLFLVRAERTGTEISRLEPVELVRVTEEDGVVAIETDTGACGYGSNIDTAVENLHASSSGTVFLDTAEYLLLSSETQKDLPQLYRLLRPACQVCFANDPMDLTEAASYLKTHSPDVKLLHCRAGETQLPTLYLQEGRGQLVRGNNQS